MSLDWESMPPTLRTVLRPAPPLAPEDSLRRFVQIGHQSAYHTLPVLQNGKVCGVLSTRSVWSLLAIEDREAREHALNRPISEYMTQDFAMGLPGMTLQELAPLFAEHNQDCLPIVDLHGFCLGIVSAFDMLTPNPTPPRPPMVGGMATPFGVYLTDGTHQAGAGNIALAASGAMMGLLYFIAYLIVGGGVRVVQALTHQHSAFLFRLDTEPPIQQPWTGLLYVALGLLTTFVFLVLMRTTLLAGYHAAEHQTVHALEHGERLLPEIVRRMPRPHPRCGTNFLAAGLVFLNLAAVLHYHFLDTSTATLLAAVATLFTWRQVGTFLQETFTTRPPNTKQVESGIAAATGLLQQYWSSPPTRTNFFRRFWCTGLLQVVSGMAPTMALTLTVLDRLKLF